MIKKIEKITMVPMGKIYSNCHNSGCTQHKVVIFDSMVWFGGSGNLTASLKFTPG